MISSLFSLTATSVTYQGARTPRIVAYRSLLSLIRRRLTPALGHATLADDRVSWTVRISSY